MHCAKRHMERTFVEEDGGLSKDLHKYLFGPEAPGNILGLVVLG